MRKLAYTISLILLLMAITKNTLAQIPKNDALFDTVFVENFTGSTLNGTKWQGCYQWGQFYSNNVTPNDSDNYCDSYDVAGLNFDITDTVNRKISGGTCKMIGKKGNKKLKNWTWPGGVFTTDSIIFKYTNAMLQSRATFKFGYFEIKFRMPSYTSSAYTVFSPTFWLYNSTPSTHWSELDIYEIDGTHSTLNLTNAIHIDTTGNDNLVWNWNIIGQNNHFTLDVSTWHTAAMNWTPNSVDFYLDSTLVRHIKSDSLKLLIEMPMIIENGVPATNYCTNPIDNVNTPFPVTYEIDYVKVWQPLCDCNVNKNYCNVTESTFVSKIYKSLTLGGIGCSSTFNNMNALSAEANDYVLLDEGFEVGNNINMTIDVQSYCSDSLKYIQNAITNPTQPPANFIQTYKSIKSTY